MSGAQWITDQILKLTISADRAAESRHCKFNPRPIGILRPGSATEAVYKLLASRPDQFLWRYQVISITGRSRKSVDWALQFLVAVDLVETSPPKGEPRDSHLRFRAAVK